MQGTTFVYFSSVTSAVKLKTHSQLTQSPFTGTDCLLLLYLQPYEIKQCVSIYLALCNDSCEVKHVVQRLFVLTETGIYLYSVVAHQYILDNLVISVNISKLNHKGLIHYSPELVIPMLLIAHQILYVVSRLYKIYATLNYNQTAIAACIKAQLDKQIITDMYSTSKPIPSLLSNPHLGTITNLLPLMSLSIYLVMLVLVHVPK